MLQTRLIAPVVIDKTPECCPEPDQLQAGDILIFNINPHQKKPNTHPTVFGQQMLNNPGGHKDAVHAAFVVEIEGKKKIAHLRATGFALDDVNTIKTVTHIYRPLVHQKELATELNHFIQTNKDKLARQVHWVGIVSFFSFIRRLFSAVGIKNEDPETKEIANVDLLPPPQKTISSWSICSKFLSEAYVTSCYALSKKDEKHTDYRHDLMNISVNTVPKTLQAYLYRCSNYDYLVMPHQEKRGKLMAELMQCIDVEIKRLRNLNDIKSKQKVDALRNKLNEMQPEEKAEITVKKDFENALLLLKSVVPILKINTGNNIKTPTSYTNVMNFAKTQGLYAYYFENDLTFNAHHADVTKEAETALHYDRKFAALYSNYRKSGYSDQEARFECNPSFGEWFKLSPRRNIAAVVTVLPFLFWSLPYGLSRVCKAHHRNEVLRRQAILSQ